MNEHEFDDNTQDPFEQDPWEQANRRELNDMAGAGCTFENDCDEERIAEGVELYYASLADFEGCDSSSIDPEKEAVEVLRARGYNEIEIEAIVNFQ